MAIARIEYITVLELNEILFASFPDDDDTKKLIIEASELISYHTMQKSDTLFASTSNLDNLKIATAYQVEYFDNNFGIDTEYGDNSESISLGRYSQSSGGTSSGNGATQEWKKIAPKTNRYLMKDNLLFRGLDRRSTYGSANIID